MIAPVARLARFALLGVFAVLFAGGCMASRDYYYDDGYDDDDYEYEVDRHPTDPARR